jgi:citrate synthase
VGDDPVFRTVAIAFETIPGVLKEQGKAQNPWPNVDAGSGALLYHFGLEEFEYYTVLFATSRAIGMLSQLVLNRALMLPIVRPKAISTRAASELASKGSGDT